MGRYTGSPVPPGHGRLVYFDDFVGETGGRSGANTCHGGERDCGLSRHHANERPLGIGFREWGNHNCLGGRNKTKGSRGGGGIPLRVREKTS